MPQPRSTPTRSRVTLLPLGLLTLGLLASAPVAAQATDSNASTTPGRLPFVFEANTGRWDARARFVARGDGYRLFTTASGIVIDLSGPDDAGDRDPARAAIAMRFVGSNPEPAIVGGRPSATRIHHLTGSPEHWSTGNETFAAVRYREVWPGVDAVCYGRDGELEYDFVVAPGADPSMVRVRWDGIEACAIDPAGDLVLRTPVGRMVQTAPVIYQEREGGREVIDGRFVIRAPGVVGFEIAGYDRSRPLVIDPILRYASYFGGSATTHVHAVATDAAGHAYIAGKTDAGDLPVTTGAYQTTRGGNRDAFIAKLSPNGDALLWCTYLGGSLRPLARYQGDVINDMQVDANGDVYVGGETECIDFPVTGWSHSLSSIYSQAFVAKLSSDGSSLLWSVAVSGAGRTAVNGIHVDATGHVVAGGLCGMSFPTTASAFQTSGNPNLVDNGFVFKLLPDGSAPVWSSYYRAVSGRLHCRVTDVSADAAGRVYFVGVGLGNLAVTPTAFQPGYGGGGYGDGFLARLSADGATLDYATYLGGSSTEGGRRSPGVACDDAGRAWFAGDTDSTDWPVSQGAFQPQSAGGFDAVVACIDTTRSGAASLVFSTYIGGGRIDTAGDVLAGAGGTVWVAGVSSSSDFPVRNGWQPCHRSSPSHDSWLLELDAVGGLVFSTMLGGSGDDRGGFDENRIARDPSGALYLTGSTHSTDLATPGAYQSSPRSTLTGFVAKFVPGNPTAASATVRTGCTVPGPPGSLIARDVPLLGRTLEIEIGDPTDSAGMPHGSAMAFWLISLTPPANLPCGLVVPGVGEVLIGIGGGQPAWVSTGQRWTGPGSPVVLRVPIPCQGSLGGAQMWTQAIFVFGQSAVMTDALDLVLGG